MKKKDFGMVLCLSLWIVSGCGDDADKKNTEEEETEYQSDSSQDTATERDVDDDVCGFNEAVSLGDAEKDGMVTVPANHPEIRYMGRVDCSDPEAPAFGFPGVSIRAKFEGTGIDMILVDEGTASQPNFYNVIIDDGDPTVLEMTPGENTYELARDLTDEEHTVEIFKRIESNDGTGRAEFLGFRIMADTDLLPVEARPHRLEVIGDSITCGYGNEISTTDPGSYPYTTQNSNAWNAWTAIAVRDLNAEYMAVAYSGRGIYRNYADYDGKTLPEMYLDTIPDGSSTAWDTERFTPEVVVINLGTNDFSPGIDDIDAAVETFELTYLEFVETLRGYYPEAVFILAVGPMVTDDYPTGYNTLTNITESLENIIAARKTDGDEAIHFLNLPTISGSGPWGEDWHPTVETHMEIAEDLMDLIDNLELM